MDKKPLSRMYKRVSTVGKAKSPETDVVKIKTETSGLGALKTLITAAIIGVQLALIIYLNVTFGLLFNWYLAVSFVLSLITCIYVLSSKKNSLSKAVWIIFLLLGFSFAHVIYLLSDERIFFAKSKKRFAKIYSDADKFTQKSDTCVENPCVKNDCEYLYSAGKFPAYTDTSAKYFSSGASLFDDVLERLKKAEKFIFIEFFIISDGNLLKRFIDVLKDRVASGVTVRIIYDDMGSHKTFSRKSKSILKKAGVKISPFNRLVPIFSVALNYRDHRKMIIVDGKTVYSGGSNLADEYVNEKRMYGYWKDTGIRLDGGAVDSFTLMFLRQWEFLNKTREDYSQFLNQVKKESNVGSVVVPYADGLDYKMPIGKNAYENMIASATEKIYIMTPYFIVDDTINGLLMNKALSGVDVRIILPEVPDKAFVYAVSRNNAEKLIEYGVKVYLMKNSFVHSKLLLTENSVVVGSINMDLRSFYQQFECAVYTDDKGVMDDVLDDFNQTFNDCYMITENNKKRKNVLYRIFNGLMQVFAPFM